MLDRSRVDKMFPGQKMSDSAKTSHMIVSQGWFCCKMILDPKKKPALDVQMRLQTPKRYFIRPLCP